MTFNYWNDYYENNGVPHDPSRFARFCLKEYIKKGQLLVDLGCGNGRDSFYFVKHKVNVLGIDYSTIIDKMLSFPMPLFIRMNLEKINKWVFNADVIYARFLLHSISEQCQDKIICWAFDDLKEGGLLCLEFRSVKDDLYGKGEKRGRDTFFFNRHARRFIRKEEIEEEIRKAGFRIIYSLEDKGLSPFGRENPMLIRIVAKK